MTYVWPWIAAALTLIVLSRAFGDHPLFRISQYFFVGLSLGYAATIIISDVLIRQIEPAVRRADLVELLLLLIPLVLGGLLWTRIGGQQLSWAANIPLALLICVAAALALAGTIRGTLLPQLRATAGVQQIALLNDTPANMVGRIVLIVGLILVVGSFAFTRQRPTISASQRTITVLGRWWLIVSLGVVFAGALLTYQTALIDRIQFLARQFGFS